jgi:phosphatidylglycerophosphatase A
VKNKLVLFVAQGFGVGRSPVAPGTFGSVVGLGWFALLLATGNLWVFIGGTILGLVASVWFCGAGEKILGQTDPGSIVLDEITAMPVCFVGWVWILVSQTGAVPAPGFFFSGKNLWLTLGVLAVFRLFDVWKPWPVKQSQKLPGGWGVTVDDVLAAVYVNLCFYAFALVMIEIVTGKR